MITGANMVEAVLFKECFGVLLVSAMEHYGEQSDSKTKRKGFAMGLEVLVEEASKHVVELQQRNINITQRNAIRESTCEKVNVVGKTKRTTDEIKRRWQDTRRTKEIEKIAHYKTSANKTGGWRHAIVFFQTPFSTNLNGCWWSLHCHYEAKTCDYWAREV